MKIEKFSFNDEGRQRVGEKSKGKDWPVVYIINNEKKYMSAKRRRYIIVLHSILAMTKEEILML